MRVNNDNLPPIKPKLNKFNSDKPKKKRKKSIVKKLDTVITDDSIPANEQKDRKLDNSIKQNEPITPTLPKPATRNKRLTVSPASKYWIF